MEIEYWSSLKLFQKEKEDEKEWWSEFDQSALYVCMRISPWTPEIPLYS
jgi:hypothetical protein